jgi:hypothetical protein
VLTGTAEMAGVPRTDSGDGTRRLRILFASVAADGHFNPMTGIAAHLRDSGHDVRWYTGAAYAPRLEELRIPHFPFRRAREINSHTIPVLFPERARLKGPALIRFDFDERARRGEVLVDIRRSLIGAWPSRPPREHPLGDTDQQWRMRLLHRTRPRSELLDALELAVIRERLASPHALEHPHIFFEAANAEPGRIEADACRTILVFGPAGAEAGLRTTAAQHIERGPLAGSDSRMTEIEIHDECSQPRWW